jgi:hypothetical protein
MWLLHVFVKMHIYIYIKKKIHSVLIKINIRIIKKNVRITCIFELVST